MYNKSNAMAKQDQRLIWRVNYAQQHDVFPRGEYGSCSKSFRVRPNAAISENSDYFRTARFYEKFLCYIYHEYLFFHHALTEKTEQI